MTIYFILYGFTNWFKIRLQRSTRGFDFHAYGYKRRRVTIGYKICEKSEIDFHGIMQEIIKVDFFGLVRMK